MPIKQNPKNYNQDDLVDRQRMELELEYEAKELDDEPAVTGDDAAAPVAEAANGASDERDLGTDHLRFRSIKEIIADLSKPISPRHIRQRTQGKTQISYIEWHTAVRYLDFYAPGWQYIIRRIDVYGDRLVLVCRITIPAREGLFSREASGQEELNAEVYGDPSSNAEAMALKRAAAKFGLGLHLYY